MRLISALAIISFLGGCPVELDVPDASVPELDQAVGGRAANGSNPDGNAGTAGAGAFAGRGAEGGFAGSAVPPRDGGAFDPSQPTSNFAPARLRLLLTDAPGELEQLWVEIRGAEGHLFVNGGDHWVPLMFPARRIDLLTLRGGVTERLGEAAVPPGAYRQLRLRLAPEGTAVLVGGEQRPLPLAPEFGEQGVLVDLGIDARGGMTYTVVLDFDGAASVRVGESGPVLAPVIRVKDISEMRSEEATDMVPPPPAPDGGSSEQPPPPPPADGGVGEPPPDGGDDLPPPPPPQEG